MDWKQFIAEMAKSLAWPLVALVILLSLRKHIGGFLDRIRELKSGSHSIVADQLNEGRENIEAIAEETPEIAIAPLNTDDRDGHLKSWSMETISKFTPHGIILDAFEEIKDALVAFREPLGIATRSNLNGIAVHLKQRGIIDVHTLRLFNNLYEVRNTIRHDPQTFISIMEAVDFEKQSKVLVALLRNALNELKKNVPLKSEG